MTSGKSIDDWAHELQSVTPEAAREQELLFEYVSQYRTQGEKIYISNHDASCNESRAWIWGRE